MNQIMLYHIWKRVLKVFLSSGESYDELENPDYDIPEDEYIESKEVTYELLKTVTSLDEVQEMTQGSNGRFVYTWSEAWYGESDL